MPEIPRNLPYRGQVRRITPGNGGSIRINWVLVDMARGRRRDPKYQAFIRLSRWERLPKSCRSSSLTILSLSSQEKLLLRNKVSQ